MSRADLSSAEGSRKLVAHKLETGKTRYTKKEWENGSSANLRNSSFTQEFRNRFQNNHDSLESVKSFHDSACFPLFRVSLQEVNLSYPHSLLCCRRPVLLIPGDLDRGLEKRPLQHTHVLGILHPEPLRTDG